MLPWKPSPRRGPSASAAPRSLRGGDAVPWRDPGQGPLRTERDPGPALCALSHPRIVHQIPAPCQAPWSPAQGRTGPARILLQPHRSPSLEVVAHLLICSILKAAFPDRKASPLLFSHFSLRDQSFVLKELDTFGNTFFRLTSLYIISNIVHWHEL